MNENPKKNQAVENPMKLNSATKMENIGSKFDSAIPMLAQDSYICEYSSVSVPNQRGLNPKKTERITKVRITKAIDVFFLRQSGDRSRINAHKAR